MMIKFKFFVFLLLLVLPLLLYGQKKVVDRIIAVVDNEVILESELNMQVMQYAAQEKVDPQNPALRKMILESIIDNQLVLAQARLDSIVVTDDEISLEIDDRIKNLIQQYGSEERLAQAANMSVNRIKNEFKEDTRKQLLIKKAKQQKLMSIRVSRREVEDFFRIYKDSLPPVPDEVNIYHILIYPKPSNTVKKQTMDFAKKILDSIKSGSDFSIMAQRYSEHTSGKSGGDLPWVKRGTFVKEFEESAFALQTGQVSNVIESPLGLHIIKLLDRKGDAILVKQILFKIKKTENDDKSTIDLLNEIKTKIANGEKFSDLAKKYSEDVNTKDFGGYLGNVAVSELPDNIASTVKKLKEGQISEPERIIMGNNYGYHIIFLDKFIPSHKMTLETDMIRVENMAKNYKMMNELKAWIEEIKKNVYLDIKI